MNKSANVLTRLPDSFSILLIAAALIAYALPWVTNPGVSLTLGAYDLAEWTSLSRDVDKMDTVLLLRLPPVLVVLISAVLFGYPRFTCAWWLTALFMLFMTAALLPPIEFLQDTGNTNYRQQLMIAGLTFFAGVAGLSGLLPRFRPVLVLAIAVATAAISLTGITQALQFMGALGLPAAIGTGAVGFIAITLIIGGVAIRRRRILPPAAM